MSAEGLFVTHARGVIAALKPDSMVDVEVTFDGETLVLFGVVPPRAPAVTGSTFPRAIRPVVPTRSIVSGASARSCNATRCRSVSRS